MQNYVISSYMELQLYSSCKALDDTKGAGWMIDLNKWIYSKGIAAWLTKKGILDVKDQINCICAAPHRTLAEKLDGLKELSFQCHEKILDDKIKDVESELNCNCPDAIMQHHLFRAEIFYQGEPNHLLPNSIFRTAKESEDEIRQHIEILEEKFHAKKEYFCGIIKEFQDYSTPHRFIPTRKFTTRYDGHLISIQKIYKADGWNSTREIGNENLNYLKVPYSSGTIISITGSPFFSPLKGLLVNTTEPEDDSFLDDPYNQWLIYPSLVYTSHAHGIGIANLGNDYLPFQKNQDFRIPYKQFIDINEEELNKNELWLLELSMLIKSNKNYFNTFLHDRKPKSGAHMDEDRLRYIRKLAEKI